MSKKDRDEAIERVGRQLYGKLWIGDLRTQAWELTRRARNLGDLVDLPANPKEAANVAQARLLNLASGLQNGQVLRWLAQQGVNCVASSFDRAKFEAWFRKTFDEQIGSATDKRQAAVRELLEAGRRPGRGGCSWKEFDEQVRARTGMDFDIKTLRRDVDEILPSLSGLDISDIPESE
jgi:hypothetical protein